MGRFLSTVLLIGLAIPQSPSFAGTGAAQEPVVTSVPRSMTSPDATSGLPPIPLGNSTVLGGAIRHVDRVRDQLTLKIFGGHEMHLLFDERTQVYRDGSKTTLHELHDNDHVSVETLLDGTAVFARSIRILSRTPEGEFQGQVLNYNPGSGELTVRDSLSSKPVNLRISVDTVIVHEFHTETSSREAGFQDIPGGTLVSVNFKADTKGGGVASRIAILATPGDSFVFVGTVVFLDLHDDLLVIVDPQDSKSHKINIPNTRFSIDRDLHEGASVVVTAKYDGGMYVATAISVSPAAAKAAR